jgi:hypothetical protein
MCARRQAGHQQAAAASVPSGRGTMGGSAVHQQGWAGAPPSAMAQLKVAPQRRQVLMARSR